MMRRLIPVRWSCATASAEQVHRQRLDSAQGVIMRFMPLLLFPSLLAICGLASAQQVMGAVSGPGRPQTAAVAAAASAPVVVDNSGKVVGPLFDRGVILTINGALVFAPLRRLSAG